MMHCLSLGFYIRPKSERRQSVGSNRKMTIPPHARYKVNLSGCGFRSGDGKLLADMPRSANSFSFPPHASCKTLFNSSESTAQLKVKNIYLRKLSVVHSVCDAALGSEELLIDHEKPKTTNNEATFMILSYSPELFV